MDETAVYGSTIFLVARGTLVLIKQTLVPPISSLCSSGDISGQGYYPEFNDDIYMCIKSAKC